MAAVSHNIPKTLGACVDKLYRKREERRQAQKKVDAIKAEITTLKNHLIEHLPKSDAEGVIGKAAKGVITKKQVPAAKDWEAFYKYMARKKAFHLMQKRLSSTAFNELWEDGKKIPVEPFTVLDVSVTKRR